MRSTVLTLTLTLALTYTATAAVSQKDKDRNTERLTDAADLFKEIMGTPDKSIPQDLVEKAYCIVVVPGLKKAAFGIGGKYGRGFAICRNPNSTGRGPP